MRNEERLSHLKALEPDLDKIAVRLDDKQRSLKRIDGALYDLLKAE